MPRMRPPDLQMHNFTLNMTSCSRYLGLNSRARAVNKSGVDSLGVFAGVGVSNFHATRFSDFLKFTIARLRDF